MEEKALQWVLCIMIVVSLVLLVADAREECSAPLPYMDAVHYFQGGQE